MAMYVILTSKPGKFKTEILSGLRPLAAYDYLFYGEKKAHFVIAELLDERAKVRVIEDGTGIINDVRSKFFEKFNTVERALDEIKHLTTFGHMKTNLCEIHAAGH
jgi:hypothetical protein